MAVNGFVTYATTISSGRCIFFAEKLEGRI